MAQVFDTSGKHIAEQCSIHRPHARRKAIYEKLHPDTAIPGRGKNQYVPTDNMSVGTPTYAADAANAVGETEVNLLRLI